MNWDLQRESELTLRRLLPRVREAVAEFPDADVILKREFEERLEEHFPLLFRQLFSLYGDRYDFTFHLEKMLQTAARCAVERPAPLRDLDRHRVNEPGWFLSQRMVGGALYVDLFSENLNKLRELVPYFKDLGLTYLHLMPLFAVRPGDSDGGYAVSNYRSINPQFGTFEDLVGLSNDLRSVGISLVLDFIFNHTSDDHEWALQAQAGESEYEGYYFLFPDRTIPDRYEANLREIFPTVRRGNFTWHDGMRKWVWTTFNSFQWDLNYRNPAVFNAMLGEMLFLANTGVDILRLDAVAFVWKQMGTSCENRPEAHTLIRAFNTFARIAAPGLLFKSEAIVHPDEVVRYIDLKECQLSYNPLLMALLWESLATREVKLLAHSMRKRFAIPPGCSWANYLRCHDDIGWTFDDDDARSLGIDPYGHRNFLNEFYTGQFPGSFARGVPFQHNPQTGDMRISGTQASLAGLEQAIENDDPGLIDLAVRRILLLHSVLCSIGGMPLLYLGEEWGILNDYDYIKDPAKAGDSRWIHRPKMKWEFLVDPRYEDSVHKRIFDSIRHLIGIRSSHHALAGMRMEVVDSSNPHVLGYLREADASRLVFFANFSEQPQQVAGNIVRTAGMGRFFKDLASGEEVGTSHPIALAPYQFRWLERA